MYNLLTLFLLSMSFNSFSHLGEIEWRKKSEKSGVIIYTPLKYKHSSGVVPLKFEATLNYNISKVLSVLDDETRKNEWLPSIDEITPLEVKSTENKIVYYRYKTPWPLSKRDFIIHSIAEFSKSDMAVTVKIKSVSHGMDPKLMGVVRGISVEGLTRIIFLSENKTKIEMSFLNDFKGSIPKFIINYVQANWPYKFVKNLNSQLIRDDILINPEFILTED